MFAAFRTTIDRFDHAQDCPIAVYSGRREARSSITQFATIEDAEYLHETLGKVITQAKEAARVKADADLAAREFAVWQAQRAPVAEAVPLHTAAE